MKLPQETREKLLMMAASIEANRMSAVEAAAYAAELRLIVEAHGGAPSGFAPEPAEPY